MGATVLNECFSEVGIIGVTGFTFCCVHLASFHESAPMSLVFEDTFICNPHPRVLVLILQRGRQGGWGGPQERNMDVGMYFSQLGFPSCLNFSHYLRRVIFKTVDTLNIFMLSNLILFFHGIWLLCHAECNSLEFIWGYV